MKGALHTKHGQAKVRSTRLHACWGVRGMYRLPGLNQYLQKVGTLVAALGRQVCVTKTDIRLDSDWRKQNRHMDT